jgi:hypothetical protein
VGGGWSISGITIIQSGTPFSVLDSLGGSGFLGAGYTTTLTGSLVPGETISQGYSTGGLTSRVNNGYLNPAAFTPAPLLYPFDPANPTTTCSTANSNFCTTNYGNLARNTYRGPHQQNWDFSLIKNFPITERVNLRFSTDFFNIWNHPNFANPPITDVETIGPNGPFGKIFSTVGTPRLIQFSLRLTF